MQLPVKLDLCLRLLYSVAQSTLKCPADYWLSQTGRWPMIGFHTSVHSVAGIYHQTSFLMCFSYSLGSFTRSLIL